jgi:diacylglycerol O-acyltransferase
MRRMHRRLARSHYGMRRPVWEPVEDVAADEHVHVRRVARPGDQAALELAVRDVMEAPLDPSLPLWDAWVLTGLSGRRWALVWRVHHSVADGLGSLALIGQAFDTSPDGGPTLAEAVLRRGRPGAAPEGRPGRLVGAAGSVLHAAGAVVAALPHLAPAIATALPAPPSSLTGPVGPHRLWATARVPIAEVKAAAHGHGVTVNDVVLAAVTAAWRDLLLARGEEVRGRSVRTLVPVSVRRPGDDATDNQVSGLVTPLPVGIADPVERLAAVTATVDHLKHAHAPVAGVTLLGLADHLVPAALQDAVLGTAGATMPSWFFETVTTNVPGPWFPVYALGRRVRASYPIIPVAGHTQVTTGVYSFDDALHIAVTGDAGAFPDVAVIAAGVPQAIAALVRAVPPGPG